MALHDGFSRRPDAPEEEEVNGSFQRKSLVAVVAPGLPGRSGSLLGLPKPTLMLSCAVAGLLRRSRE